MFDFAVERDMIPASPCAAIKPYARECPRDRVLTDEEIRAFLVALAQNPMSDGVRLAIELALVTAQRRCEVAGARKTEFDLARAVWAIPKERSKNRRAHFVPLSSAA